EPAITPNGAFDRSFSSCHRPLLADVTARIYVSHLQETRAVSSEIESELGMLAPLDAMMHPYRQRYETHAQLPGKGHDRAAILAQMEELRALEQDRWREGYASGSVYNGDEEHIAFVNKVYNLQSQCNQLHTDLWPSAAKFEAEIVSMTAHML